MSVCPVQNVCFTNPTHRSHILQAPGRGPLHSLVVGFRDGQGREAEGGASILRTHRILGRLGSEELEQLPLSTESPAGSFIPNSLFEVQRVYSRSGAHSDLAAEPGLESFPDSCLPGLCSQRRWRLLW